MLTRFSTMISLQSYLINVLGIRITFPKKLSENLSQVQNSTFAKSYSFYEITLAGVSVIVADRKNPEGFNGSNIVKEYKQMKEYFGFPLLLELSVNDSAFRRQLINKKVNFVVPGRQLYFPELFISLSEAPCTKRKAEQTLTISAQVLLLYHLQKKSLAGIPFKEIAGQIGYSAKTVSLAVEELCNFGIAKVAVDGQHKTLQFYKYGVALYLQVEKLLQSPVIASGYTDNNVNELGLFQVGDGVLNNAYSDIPQYQIYGISSRRAKDLKLRVYSTHRKFSVEVWKYSPALVGSDDKADLLSVLLSTIETWNGTPNRYHYDKIKKSVLEKVKWTDTANDD